MSGDSIKRSDSAARVPTSPDWDEQFRLALYGDHARKIHERDGATETCPVCGDLCAVKMVNELFGTKGKKRTGKKK